MSKEILNLLLGASISLLASILTIIVTGVIQIIRDTRTRKWQIEDNENEIVRKLMAQRIDELEAFTREIVFSLSSINSTLPSLLNETKEKELFEYCLNIHKEIIDPHAAKAEYFLSLALYFHNEILYERFKNIFHTITDLCIIINDILSNLNEKKNLDYGRIKNDLEKLSILKSYDILLLTFDLIRSNPDKLFSTLKNKKRKNPRKPLFKKVNQPD